MFLNKQATTCQGQFVHKEMPLVKDCPITIIDGKRHYVTPYGDFPSVTTILSDQIKDGIAAWKSRVGEKEATRIRDRAAIRGETVHALCERYVNNEQLDNTSANPFNWLLFKSLKPILDKFVNNVFGVEICLYSKKIKVAGRVDLIAEWDGVLSIIDYKTATHEKKEEYVHNYFRQESAYALCFEELFNIPIKQVVTVVANESAPPQVFISKTDQWIISFISLRKEYEKKYDT